VKRRKLKITMYEFAQLRLGFEPRFPLFAREPPLGLGVVDRERERDRLGVRDLLARFGLAWRDFPDALTFPEERLPVLGIENRTLLELEIENCLNFCSKSSSVTING
jgi:hypothetical protein